MPSAIKGIGIRHGVTLPDGQGLEILRGVDIDLAKGDSVAIIGRSGSGKTTLLSVLGLLSPLQAGSLMIGGQETSRLTDRRRAAYRNGRIGFVFQSYSLVGYLSASENVELPLLYGRRMAARERRRRVEHALELVGLSDRATSPPRLLSGGEQQRVAIARALVRDPDVILADEPTGALDVKTATRVLDVLLEATRAHGCSLVVVTHEADIAERLGKTLVLDAGILVESRQ